MFDISFEFYPITMALGAIMCFVYLYIFAKKMKWHTSFTLTVILNGLIAIFIGIIFAILFQNLYNYIENPKDFTFSLGLTFYGGLIGGVISFIFVYLLFMKKKYPNTLSSISVIAPACITIAHGIGRIGCFLDGCCYGKTTDSIFGIRFASTGCKVFPTNLYEAIFLILLSLLLLFLAIKKNTRYTFSIYMFSYSIFRFLIEFLRDDHRGNFIPGLTPSQFWSIVLFVMGALYTTYLIYKDKKKARD